MRAYAARRLGAGLLQIAAVVTIVHLLTSVLPGDAAVVVLGENATDAQREALRASWGLDRPWGEQFLDWLGGLVHGDLGTSLRTGRPVTADLADELAGTAVLAAVTLACVIPLAVVLGVVSGARPGSRTDRTLNTALVILHAIPEFALGMFLVAVFALEWGWFPATAAGLSGFSLAEQPAVLVLPVAVLVCTRLCALARQIRIGVAEAREAEYATHLRVLGVPERTVLLRTVVPNGLAPAVQQVARTVDGLLGGVVVVEALFGLTGVGAGFVEAVKARDLPVVQGYAVLFVVTTVVVNVAADVAARRLVPQREVVA
ncbi:ABC transporter permease [Prauserella rugosa]|uniref:Peptide/nickel transport system permease protein n=1 Tax=Prauserella rugosa TaxID=43354 RepID=A0A660C7C7_9PSEU|nr:ABC transporter permease [Prauserella rugosa]KID31614.1 ABC-type dipeptide/oligopeptide/nickel transport system, permease component [Prauserella sp. Am3]TWH19428.1 peptide/nickel transport system permease protein [Prauserella rugosa]